MWSLASLTRRTGPTPPARAHECPGHRRCVRGPGLVDHRLAVERAAGASEDPLRACRVASLHWDRAERLSQQAYYRSLGNNWEEDREPAYTVFRSERLRRDESGDVAAAMASARHALRRASHGPERVRALCILTIACAALGRWDEDLGGTSSNSRATSRSSLLGVAPNRPRLSGTRRSSPPGTRGRAGVARRHRSAPVPVHYPRDHRNSVRLAPRPDHHSNSQGSHAAGSTAASA